MRLALFPGSHASWHTSSPRTCTCAARTGGLPSSESRQLLCEDAQTQCSRGSRLNPCHSYAMTPAKAAEDYYKFAMKGKLMKRSRIQIVATSMTTQQFSHDQC